MLHGWRVLAAFGVVPLTLASAPLAAAAPRCQLLVETFLSGYWGGILGGYETFQASYLPTTTQIHVRVSPDTCAWSIDRGGTASWLGSSLYSGKRRDDGRIVGSAYIELTTTRNPGPARVTGLRFGSSAGWSEVLKVAQQSPADLCAARPTVIGDTQSSVLEPGILALTNYAPSSGPPPAQILYRFQETGRCEIHPVRAASTGNLDAPTTQILLEAQPSKYLIRHPGIAVQQEGAAALFNLFQIAGNLGYRRSAVLIRYLKKKEDLPVDLRIDPQTLSQSVVAFSDGGGIATVTGHAVRSTSNPNRPCAFDSKYFHVILEVPPGTGGQWLQIKEGSCTPGHPDDGKLVISAYPSAPGIPRFGAIYSDWGSAIVVVER